MRARNNSLKSNKGTLLAVICQEDIKTNSRLLEVHQFCVSATPESTHSFGLLRTPLVITWSDYINVCLSQQSVKPFLKTISNQNLWVSLLAQHYESKVTMGDLNTYLWFSASLAFVLLQSWSALFNITVRFEEWGAVHLIPFISAWLLEGELNAINLGCWAFLNSDPSAKGNSPMAFSWQLNPVCRIRAATRKELAQESKTVRSLNPFFQKDWNTDLLVNKKIFLF